MRPVGIIKKAVRVPGIHRDRGSAEEQARRIEAAKAKRQRKVKKDAVPVVQPGTHEVELVF